MTLIKNMVRPCQCAADIGTDHGFLICALVSEGISQKGIAADINEQPLAKATTEISLQGLTSKIQTICTNGLHDIPRDEVDAIIIAGMGGDLIASILNEWKGSTNAGKHFYLNPMTKPEKLRKYLYENNFTMIEERCAVAAGRAYSVIHATYTNTPVPYSDVDLYLGAINASAGEAEQEYCNMLLSKIKNKVSGIESGTDHSRLEYWKDLLEQLNRRVKL